MVCVEEAEKIILQQCMDFGTEMLALDKSLGRVLAEDILADRDFPPFDRTTMDGIAIRHQAFKNGEREFRIVSTQSAGEQPIGINSPGECIEIMTGAALPSTTDTVIPYEEVEIKDGIATIKTESVLFHQNIHPQGKDKKQKEVLAKPGQFITPALIAIAATVGKASISVKRVPSLIIISTGDELVDIDQTPTCFQLRRSNNYTLRALLKQQGMTADMLHLPDDPAVMKDKLSRCLDDYDILIMSGGVSMGKFDYVPGVLETLAVKKLFHKVKQRPGKPFWFGISGRGGPVFAFPGNPVSTFMCFHRYFLPWLKASWKVKTYNSFAILSEDFIFKPPLQYFLQVKLTINDRGELMALPAEGHGSGDFANLLQTDAFMELPLERDYFKKGEVFPIWTFKQML